MSRNEAFTGADGRRWHFAFTSGFAGETDYEILEPAGARYRAHLQHTICDYWRDQWERTGALADRESRLGLLVRSVGDNAGEISADTIEAFNAWQRREFEAFEAWFAARYPGDTHTESAPAPIAAGRWTRADGWQRVESSRSRPAP